eukprot:4809364-Prymnesium_polylepis.2
MINRAGKLIYFGLCARAQRGRAVRSFDLLCGSSSEVARVSHRHHGRVRTLGVASTRRTAELHTSSAKFCRLVSLAESR